MKGYKLPPSGKEYLYFQTDRETSHSAQCAKSRALTKVVDSIIDLESFEHKCVIIQVSFH